MNDIQAIRFNGSFKVLKHLRHSGENLKDNKNKEKI